MDFLIFSFVMQTVYRKITNQGRLGRLCAVAPSSPASYVGNCNAKEVKAAQEVETKAYTDQARLHLFLPPWNSLWPCGHVAMAVIFARAAAR